MLSLILLLNISFAITFSFSKLIITYINPIWFLGIRMTIIGLFFLIIFLFTHSQKIKYSRLYIIALCLVGFLNIYITNIFQLWSLELLPAAKTSLLYNSNPFFIIILSYFLLKEKITWQKIIAFLLGWSGLFLSLMHKGHILDFSISSGEIFALISASATAISAIMLYKIMRNNSYPLSLTTGLSVLIGGIIACFHALYSSQNIMRHLAPLWVIGASALVTIASIMCAGLYNYLLKTYRASFVSFTGFSVPIFAAFFDWLLFGTIVSWNFYVSMILISTGLYIFYQEDKKLSL